MRILCFIACVTLAAPCSAHGQEKRPKTTLLHYANPSQYFDYYYGRELLNIPDLRVKSTGLMPPGCNYSFHGFIQEQRGHLKQTYGVVKAACPCGTSQQLYLKLDDNDGRFAKCKAGDALVFEGKFRVVAMRSIPPGCAAFWIEGADNNASVSRLIDEGP